MCIPVGMTTAGQYTDHYTTTPLPVLSGYDGDRFQSASSSELEVESHFYSHPRSPSFILRQQSLVCLPCLPQLIQCLVSPVLPPIVEADLTMPSCQIAAPNSEFPRPPQLLTYWLQSCRVSQDHSSKKRPWGRQHVCSSTDGTCMSLECVTPLDYIADRNHDDVEASASGV